MINETKMVVRKEVLNLLQVIHDYQKSLGIERKCMTNTFTMRDILINSGLECEVRACICVAWNGDKGKEEICDKHLVIKIGEQIIDPSYCIAKLNPLSGKPKYFYTIGELEPRVRCALSSIQVKNFLKFGSIANDMNNMSPDQLAKPIVCDLKYYNDQFDYIIKQLN